MVQLKAQGGDPASARFFERVGTLTRVHALKGIPGDWGLSAVGRGVA